MSRQRQLQCMASDSGETGMQLAGPKFMGMQIGAVY